MKKILSLLLIFILLFLCAGCESKSDNPSESEPNYSEGVQIIQNEEIGYKPFYDALNSLTDVVKARYVKSVDSYPESLYRFQVTESLRGGCDKDQIISVGYSPQELYVLTGNSEDDFSYDNMDLYKYGKDYLLLLSRSNWVLSDGDEFAFIEDSLVIPLDSNGKVDVTNSKVYGQSLDKHIADVELKEAFLSGAFIDKVLALTAKNPEIFKREYLETDDEETIIREADCIYAIKVVAYADGIRSQASYQKCTCEIIARYKGDYASKERKLYIFLPIDQSEMYETYIIAFNLYGEYQTPYLSSKNSVWECS